MILQNTKCDQVQTGAKQYILCLAAKVEPDNWVRERRILKIRHRHSKDIGVRDFKFI